MIKKIIFTSILAVLTGVMLYQAGALDTLFKPPTAFAVGVLTVDWGVPHGTPIFSFDNLSPGDMETHTVSISNGASLTQAVAIKALKTGESGLISNVMNMVVLKNNVPIYGGSSLTGPKTLRQFFQDSNSDEGVFLGLLQPNEQVNFTFNVTFDLSAGNSFQNKKVTFDLQVGITSELPQECTGITFTNTIVNDKVGQIIRGTNGNDLILARGGGDNIKSLDGDDCILASRGNTINADGGNDVIVTTKNGNIITGGLGNDHILAAGKGNLIKGEGGNDFIKAEDKSNFVDGGPGVNTCIGGTQKNCN